MCDLILEKLNTLCRVCFGWEVTGVLMTRYSIWIIISSCELGLSSHDTSAQPTTYYKKLFLRGTHVNQPALYHKLSLRLL